MALEIEGRHALLFDDDAGAGFVNSPAALVPWNGDQSLLIDRYDVRHLLDRIPPRQKKHRFLEDTGGVSQTDLDRERFLDLPLNEDDDDEKGTIEKKSEATASGPYQAVPFSYGNAASADPDSSGSNHSAFHPSFPVPASLHSNLPPTEKLHQIMARTALFVSEHGGQSEIVLRVKQGGNPTFGFLMPDNQLHPYFRFLVGHPQLLKAGGTQEEKGSAAVAMGGALSLLGSLYGTGEDDDNSVLPQKSLKEESTAVIVPSKEKNLLPKRNHLVHSVTTSKKGEATTSQLDSKIDVKPVIVEPPSFLKGMIEKIVEFILRNGKEFEAVLIEQDKAAGRFPFLLPSNQYHSYYLKSLQESVEDSNPSGESKRKSQEASTGEFEGRPTDPQRKEKFKMVIGASKKDPTRWSGVTTDEAAAIVLAATRGRSPFQTTPSSADSDPLSFPRSGTDADSTDASLTKAEKLKAERLKRAKLFTAMIRSGARPAPNHEEREGSCVAFEVDASAKDRNYRRKRGEEGEDSGEDKERRRKKYRHHHHHRSRRHHHEDRERSRGHGRKRRSPSEKSEEMEEGEVREKTDDATEVPSDLRAKIRAMLMETM